MKVFLSWSGKTSREVATAFHHWLPYVLQAVKPFISTGDIDKGKRWTDVLATELGEVAYGIICLTQDNFREPWINFEAGSISKAIKASYVSPFLFNVEPTSIQGPLQQFEFTVNDEEDIFNLIRSINNRFDEDQRLTEEVLRDEFKKWWPDLKRRLDAIPKIGEGNQTGLDWLYTAHDLVRIQAAVDCKCVWFITPSLFRNALVDPMKDALQENMERETSYKFIIPSSDQTGKENLELMAAKKPYQIGINDQTPWEQFRKLAVTDYLVINADSDGVQVFLELPIAARGYWIKVDAEAAMGFVVRFRPLAEHASRVPNGST